MPWMITILPANPPNVNGSPVRTSVRPMRSTGALTAPVTAPGAGAEGAAEVAAITDPDGVALALGNIGAPHAAQRMTNASPRLRTIRTTSMLRGHPAVGSITLTVRSLSVHR